MSNLECPGNIKRLLANAFTDLHQYKVEHSFHL
jgi:hypothetical protein